MTFCIGKGKAKATHSCFEHWNSTNRFLIRELQNCQNRGVNLAKILMDYYLHFGCCSLGKRREKSSINKSLNCYVLNTWHNVHIFNIINIMLPPPGWAEIKGIINTNNISVSC